MQQGTTLVGPRFELAIEDDAYPEALRQGNHPPDRLFGIGDRSVVREGLAVVGARKATPYGIGCARRFAKMAAERGIVIVSGGARGCDAVAHEAAVEAGAPTVVVLGGGCDEVYPLENMGLFQRVIDGGGAVISERDWNYKPLPFCFRERNRIIAGLARATLIVEAGLPSGTFSTADEAINAGREVLVVPGAITSKQSRGANRLIYQGATPVVDEETFADQLLTIFGSLKWEQTQAAGSSSQAGGHDEQPLEEGRFLLEAIQAEPLDLEALKELTERRRPGRDGFTWLMVWLAKQQRAGTVAQYPDGRYGPVVK